MEFSELNLHPDLQRGISDAGYIHCMPVQEQVLSHAFNGQDLYVQSQTGTGKTAAFLIVIFQRLLTESLLGGKKGIVMVPTRELAVQVEEEAKVLGKYLPFKTGSFYGGVGYAQQQKLLRDNVQILVGTPGRVLDLNKSGYMNLMDLAFLVLDEADRMFDMGFYPDLRKLIRVVPPADRRQTMLFSATLNSRVKNLAWEYTKTPYEIEIEPETVTLDEVEEILYHVQSENKMKLLLGIMEREKPESAIIFCNTKRYAEIIAKRLRINGYECEFIIGDLPQIKRLRIIDDVKEGKVHYLVATDVAARGLDIEGLALVVNYDLPMEAENYVHRIGRTARAGKTGKAITLASEQDVYELPEIEKYIGKKIPSRIADEGLYGADKSGGLRVRTDFYDDRGGRRSERGGSRGGRRDEHGGRPGGGTERGGGRSGRRGEGGRGVTGRGPSEGRGETAGPRRNSRPPGPSAGGSSGEQYDASYRLSFEERLAVYKEKYRGGEKQSPPRPGRVGALPEGRGRSGREAAGRRGRDVAVRGGPDRGGGDRTRREKAPPAEARGDGGARPAPEPAKKPGVFGKLRGLFGKKEPNTE
ncbi:MAG: DEAD/DEAH box helicase [Treponema sp.]|jgi:ATP-dependent RNA helicase RhlB|nr:DEAD/DEAH box helicase [Treponema sp.]